jgi:uncharacterized delta-60 repeat protein
MMVVRYNADGTPDDGSAADSNPLDTPFGTAGIARANFPISATGEGLAVSSDGIVIAGSTGSGSIGVARFDLNGNPDVTFGVDGKVEVFGYRAHDVVLQPDGKIVAVGDAAYLGLSDYVALRFNPDGTLDGDFGGGGVAIVGTGAYELANAVALDASGRIILAGESSDGMGGYAVGVVRLNADGTPDTAFGADGIVTTQFAGGIGYPLDVAVDTEGRIIAVGGLYDANYMGDFLVARYTPTGALDTSFGSGGTVTTAFSQVDDGAYALALQAGASNGALARSPWRATSAVSRPTFKRP